MTLMREQVISGSNEGGISEKKLEEALKASIANSIHTLNKVLLVPPDATRPHSGAGKITNIYYHLLKDICEVDILLAQGTHVAMTQDECLKMFGDIPYDRFIMHNWRTDVRNIGIVSPEFVNEISEGTVCRAINVEINKKLLDPSYDLILSIGQVVPHEVVGMANYTKNIVVGCGGSSIINASHILGAFYGMERMMGKDFSPVRKLFDFIEENFLKDIPLSYVLTVTTAHNDDVVLHGLYIGRSRALFEMAVKQSQQKNLVFTDEPFRKVVVYLDPKEFKSTWLGNKSIYRTRMAIADGGELIILAPGVERFGEDEEIDKLIRKYGYTGRQHIIDCSRKYEDLQRNMSAAAHLIHGSSDNRFKITYCPGCLTEKEVVSVGFGYMPCDHAMKKYNPQMLEDGYNNMPDGEKIFYVSNPAIGLWVDRAKF